MSDFSRRWNILPGRPSGASCPSTWSRSPSGCELRAHAERLAHIHHGRREHRLHSRGAEDRGRRVVPARSSKERRTFRNYPTQLVVCLRGPFLGPLLGGFRIDSCGGRSLFGADWLRKAPKPAHLSPLAPQGSVEAPLWCRDGVRGAFGADVGKGANISTEKCEGAPRLGGGPVTPRCPHSLQTGQRAGRGRPSRLTTAPLFPVRP